MRRALVLVAATVSVAIFAGCGAVSQMSKADANREAAIAAKIAEAEGMGAMQCAPRELATAQVALEHARHEAMEFEPVGVIDRHFAAADAAADDLLAKTRPCWEGKRDSDGDGVPDKADRCPGTPKGVKVDDSGCALDSDGDGVADHLDKCPNTPRGAKVDARGCALDSDGDGVADHLDKCPNTPRGAKVDARGCVLDSDGDGVADHLDKCPNTPKGAPVDAVGCLKDTDGDGLTDWDETRKYGTDPNNPDTDGDRLKDGDEVLTHKTDPRNRDTDRGSVPDGEEVLTKRTDPLDPKDDVPPVEMVELHVNFDFDKADVKPQYLPQIEKVAAFLKKHPEYTAVIEGHTDSMGSEEYNLKLSARRANAVAKVLHERYGIALERVTAQSLGESQPIASNDTEEGRAKNRRIYAYMDKE